MMLGSLLKGAQAANAASKVGLGGRLLQGTGLVSAAGIAAGVGIPVVDDLSQWSKKRRKEINNMSNMEFEDFQPNFIDRTILGIKDVENSGKLRDEYITTKTMEHPEILAAQSTLNNVGGELVVKPGQTVAQVLSANGAALKKARDVTRVGNIVLEDDARYGTKGAREERRRNDQDRLDLLTQQSNNLEYQRSRDRRADMQYNESLERLDRKDRRTAISNATAGLAALAAAFAI
jgi:hypothetical protein